MSRYKRGAGHVLAPGHDAADCTACAYAAGYADGERAHNPCGCDAWDAEHNDHTEAQHTDCGGHLGAPGTLCGGCDSCLSLQVAYYARQRDAREHRGST